MQFYLREPVIQLICGLDLAIGRLGLLLMEFRINLFISQQPFIVYLGDIERT